MTFLSSFWQHSGTKEKGRVREEKGERGKADTTFILILTLILVDQRRGKKEKNI